MYGLLSFFGKIAVIYDANNIVRFYSDSNSTKGSLEQSNKIKIFKNSLRKEFEKLKSEL